MSAVTHVPAVPCRAARLLWVPEEHYLGAPVRWGICLAGQPVLTVVPCFLRVQTEWVPLDLSPRLEEALDFGELEAEPSEGEDFEARGSRFSKSADERQRMLVQRKDDLLQQARR